MKGPISRRAITASVAAVAAITLGLLAACTATPDAIADASSAPSASETKPLLMHIHAAMRDPSTGDLLLATHAGLFRQTGDQLEIIVAIETTVLQTTDIGATTETLVP